MEEARRMLTIYSALDNDSRLKILCTIFNEPDIAFNDIARKTEMDKPALAYHLGVLKNVGLVEMEYQKRSKKLTKYRVTKEGEEILRKLNLVVEPVKPS
jgi:DNA-binding transcriptional ArsR family regulator